MNRLVLRTYGLVVLAMVLAAAGSALLVQQTSAAHERADFARALTGSRGFLVTALDAGIDPGRVIGMASSIVGPCLAIVPDEVLPLDDDERRRLDGGEAIRVVHAGAEYLYVDLPQLGSALEVELMGQDAAALQTAFITLRTQANVLEDPGSLLLSLDELTELERARIAWRPLIQRRGVLRLRQRVVFTFPITGGLVASPWRVDVPRARQVLFVAVGLVSAMAGVAFAMRPLRRELAALGRAARAVREGDLGVRARPHATSGAVTEVAEQFDALTERIQGLLADQEELFRSVNHELRTPIARMLFNLDLLQDASEAERRELLDKLRATTAEMQALTDELLTFARLSDTAPPVGSGEVDLGELVEDIVARWSEVELAAEVGELVVPGDSRLLFRALDNLASNAVRYAGGGRIGVEREPDWVHVVVDDEGPGIPEALRERIFQPFVRVEDSRSRQTGGTGIGLAIVRRIAQRHGGRVTAQPGPGSGSRFRLTLPRRR